MELQVIVVLEVVVLEEDYQLLDLIVVELPEVMEVWLKTVQQGERDQILLELMEEMEQMDQEVEEGLDKQQLKFQMVEMVEMELSGMQLMDPVVEVVELGEQMVERLV